MYSSLHIAKKYLELGRHAQDRHLTPMKLLKLVYIAHGWMLGLYGRPLVTEDIEAWQYGPVIPELYREMKMYGNQPVSDLINVPDLNFLQQEESIIQQVYQRYGAFTGPQLSAMTHAKGTPWHQIWHDNPWGHIPNALIQAYYQQLGSNAG